MIMMTKPLPFDRAMFFEKFDDPVLQAKVDEIEIAIFMNRQGETSLGVDFVSRQQLAEGDMSKLGRHFEQNFDADRIFDAITAYYQRQEYAEQKEMPAQKRQRGDAR